MIDYNKVYKRWCERVEDEALKAELCAIENDENEIRERFAASLSFGTAGLRGIMGAGTNRMNVYTVRHATQGLAEYIKSVGGEKRGVVIAFDSRNNSPLFAKEAAKVLCANSIRTYLFETLRPTPELSFAVRYLNCASGINITASHNPKEYNGYKVYGEDGGQLPLDAAKVVTESIAKTDIFDSILTTDEESALANGLLSYVGEEIDSEYLKNVAAQQINPDAIRNAKDFKVVYTPFHGAGNISVQRILAMAGIGSNLIVVPEQEQPDGNFPTVKSPNPEDREGFTLAIELAKAHDVDVIVGTDPDGDRIGVVVRTGNGEYIALTGNEVGAILGEYILSQRKAKNMLPEKPFVVKTVVTSEMLRAIAAKYGVEVAEVLTGFKFIAEKIKQHEDDGSGKTFVYGFEESNGYLSGSYCRDKDAVVATLLVVEMAAVLKSRGKTLYDALCDIYAEYGCYEGGVINIYKYGLDGPAEIARIIDSLRSDPPKEVAGMRVTALRDYSTGKINYSDGRVGETGLPINNMLYFELAGGRGWFAIRPSGTEPKFKVYAEVKDADKTAAKEGVKAVIDAIRARVE